MLPWGAWQGIPRLRCGECGRASVPGNYLKGERYTKLLDAFRRGLSARAAARAAGVAKQTAWKIRRQINDKTLCGCGDDPGHRGWCWARYRNSPSRQAAMAIFGVRGRQPDPWRFKPVVHAPQWPFLPAQRDDSNDLVAAIDAAVPKTLPRQIREEVCQDIAVACLEQQIPIADIEAHVKAFITQVFRTDAMGFGAPRSLDAPLRGYDGLTLGDTIS